MTDSDFDIVAKVKAEAELHDVRPERTARMMLSQGEPALHVEIVSWPFPEKDGQYHDVYIMVRLTPGDAGSVMKVRLGEQETQWWGLFSEIQPV